VSAAVKGYVLVIPSSVVWKCSSRCVWSRCVPSKSKVISIWYCVLFIFV